jgi:hypothetical protein
LNDEHGRRFSYLSPPDDVKSHLRSAACASKLTP